MKNKTKVMFLLCFTALVSSACSSNDAYEASAIQTSIDIDISSSNTESTGLNTIESEVESLEEAIQSAIDDIADDYRISDVSASLENVIDYLKKENLISGDETAVSAEMIGAISGVKYSDSNVEVYEYDPTSDVYKSLCDTMQVELQGFNIELQVSAINGAYVLFCEDSENKNDIIVAFNSFE